MGFADSSLESLSDWQGLLIFVSVCALITGIIVEKALSCIAGWVEKKEWWPRAMPLQKALMMNYGYPEAALTEPVTRFMYAYVICICTHHILCGALMIPVVMYGWQDAGASGQLAFIVGALMDVSYDVYDEFRMIMNTFFYERVGKSLFGAGKCPKEFFTVAGVLHHPLGMTMICPLVLYYPSLRSFHIIAISLLLAAGVCFTTGSYKFTLDPTKKSEWYQFKGIVFVQLVTILFTRGYIWFTQVYVALSTFQANGHMGLFYGGCVAALLMSTFNLVMIADALGAAKKWLPRSQPEEHSEDHEEYHHDVAHMVPPTPAKGAVKGSLEIARTVGLAPTAQFRADIKVMLAATRFKQGIKKPLLA
jgi:hypothetical protein